jgi:hypothetical protein
MGACGCRGVRIIQAVLRVQPPVPATPDAVYAAAGRTAADRPACMYSPIGGVVLAASGDGTGTKGNLRMCKSKSISRSDTWGHSE